MKTSEILEVLQKLSNAMYGKEQPHFVIPKEFPDWSVEVIDEFVQDFYVEGYERPFRMIAEVD